MELFGGKGRAQKIIGCFSCCFSGNLANAGDLADGGEPRPAMVFLQPGDVRGNHADARFDPAMIAIGCGMGAT